MKEVRHNVDSLSIGEKRVNKKIRKTKQRTFDKKAIREIVREYQKKLLRLGLTKRDTNWFKFLIVGLGSRLSLRLVTSGRT